MGVVRWCWRAGVFQYGVLGVSSIEFWSAECWCVARRYVGVVVLALVLVCVMLVRRPVLLVVNGSLPYDPSMVGIGMLLMIPEHKNKKSQKNKQKQVGGGMVLKQPKKTLKKPACGSKTILQKTPIMLYDGICECVRESKQKKTNPKKRIPQKS